MSYYSYVARTKDGRLEQGTVEVVSREDLIASLQAKGLLIINVSAKEAPKTQKKAARRMHRKVKSNDLVMFSRELATLLGAGVTLSKSLEILSKQVESLVLLRAIEQIKRDIEGGYTFQGALKKHDKIFSKFWLNLVETGEASGHLPSSLEQLAGYLEESAALQRKVVSALVYPIMLLCVAAVAIFVFLTKIIPIFANIFANFNVELPLLTKMVISFSNLVTKFFLFLFGILIVSIFLFRRYINTEKGRWQFDAFKFKLPVLGQLFQEVATERFASGLGTLVKSGVPILHALEIIEKTAPNRLMQKALGEVKTAVKEGKTMAEPLESSGLFAPLVVQMVRVGEEIGELSKMLDRISEFYKERVNIFVTRLTTLFEPMILIFMGIVVGVLVVAMFLPIFSISSAIKAG